MRPKLFVLGWVYFLVAGVLSPSAHSASPVIISEFMVNSSTVLTDEDNDHSDWIELHNVSSGSVNLDGWSLTDTRNSVRRWRIPATNIVANGYLVIFASAKNRSVLGLPLHTSFRLGTQGEYLALVMPDGVTIATEFAPTYPEQFNDISYGMGTSVVATQLIASGATARFLIPVDESGETNWMDCSFNDTAWNSGKTSLGFASSSSLSGSGLYAYWPVQEGSGTVASNLVAGGANGILHGAAWTTDPIRGTVLSFNGQDSYVSAGTVPKMGTTSNFTWSFWYRQRSAPNLNAVILGNRSGGAPGSLQFIKFTPSNFEYCHDGNIGFIPHAILTGGWRHLAVVKQGSSLNYYENGALVGASKAGADIEANPFYWGGDPGAPGEHVDGLINDISLWSTALTADQIRLLHESVSPSSLSGLGGFVTTEIGQQMVGVNASAYIRIPFTVAEGASFSTLKLWIQYDDGFIAYLNGVEVARRNAPMAVGWNSTATAEHPVAAASLLEEFDISAGLDALATGASVLAIQGLNLSPGDPDFLILPELEATKETTVGWRYFDHPTPGTVNDDGFLGFVADTNSTTSVGSTMPLSPLPSPAPHPGRRSGIPPTERDHLLTMGQPTRLLCRSRAPRFCAPAPSSPVITQNEPKPRLTSFSTRSWSRTARVCRAIGETIGKWIRASSPTRLMPDGFATI